MLHHAHGGDQVLGELLRMVDALQVQVHHIVVLVGAYRLAVGVQTQHRLVAAGLELLDHLAGAERDDLDRQRELADGVHDLGFVHDPDDLVGVDGHDLLPQQGRATALDAVEVVVHLVGAVNGHIDVVHIVDVHDLDAVALGLLLGAAGSRDASELQALFLHTATELVNQEPNGGTRAQAGDHAVLDQLGGFDAGRLLQRILLCLIHNLLLRRILSPGPRHGPKLSTP